MTIRLCKTCSQRSEGEVRDKVLLLCRKGCWLCPLGRKECGAVDGVTQFEMRELVMKAALLELSGMLGQLAQVDGEALGEQIVSHADQRKFGELSI